MYARLGLAALLALSGCGSVLTEATSTAAGVAGAATGAAITKNATVAAAIGLGVNSLAAVGAPGVSGSATGNPAVGIAVGIGVRAGVDEVRKYVVRHWHEGEQDAIANTAGSLPIGWKSTWEIRHSLPIGNERGELEPVRE